MQPIPTGRPPSLPVCLQSLLRRRPDIRQAEQELAGATARVGVATANLFPRFFLTGLVGQSSVGGSDFLEASSRYWSVGPTIDLAGVHGGTSASAGGRAECQGRASCHSL